MLRRVGGHRGWDVTVARVAGGRDNRGGDLRRVRRLAACAGGVCDMASSEVSFSGDGLRCAATLYRPDGLAGAAPFQALADPIVDMVQPMLYADLFPPEEGDDHPTAVAGTMFVDTIDHQVAGTIMEHLEASDAPMRVAELRVLGGAMARVPVEATDFAHRHRRIVVNLAAFYDGPADRARRRPATVNCQRTRPSPVGQEANDVNASEAMGCPPHRSRLMEAWLRRQRSWLVVEPLPGDVPELNPVEGGLTMVAVPGRLPPLAVRWVAP
jgi:hypothetical protein